MAQLTSLWYILLALLLLGVLIMIHEAGHFFSARWCGIAVKEFAIGMGPKIWSRTSKKGTLFSIRVLPLGGFCLYYGEDQELEDPRAFNNQPVWKRFFCILSGPLMNFVLALVVAIVYFSGWGAGDPIPKIFLAEPQKPAAMSGLLPGDTFVKINDRLIQSSQDVVEMINGSQGKTLQITVDRAGQQFSTELTPQYLEDKKTYLMGIVFDWVPKPMPILQAIPTSFLYCKNVIVDTFKMLGGLIFRGEGANDITGPVGIVNTIQEQTRKGGLPIYLQLAILISINLGFMNLLPIPGLDGSKLVFNIVEAIRRKPLNRNVEGMIHFIGLVALLGLMLLFTYKDIQRLFIPHS